MINLIRKLLQQLLDDIDSGNSNISEEEEIQIYELLNQLHAPYVSVYEACRLLNISRSTFYNLIKEGKIPKGQKRAGFKELSWKKTDILKVANSRKEEKNKC